VRSKTDENCGDNNRGGNNKLEPILLGQPVIPVVQIADVAQAVPMARALIAGGLCAIEVTLRSEAALGAIKAIARAVPEAIVGAGTVLNQEQYAHAVDCGAKFIVTPGCNRALFDMACSSDVPMLPGAITPSEIIEALSWGYKYLKFFPAEQAGGIAFVKALAGPFPQVKFCPTGGISAKNAHLWLALDNVVCVGGSWLVPQDLIRASNWEAITQLALEAMQLR